MECKNGDDSRGDCVASWAADGGVGGWAWKTVVSAKFRVPKRGKREQQISDFHLGRLLLLLGTARLTQNNQRYEQRGETCYQIKHQLKVSSD